MQIEFYLPLPSEGFWAALIIYYMVGLFYCLYNSLRNYNVAAHAKVFSNIPNTIGCVCMAVFAAIWPYDLIMNYRNR